MSTFTDIHERPQPYARLAGLFYLFIILAGIFGQIYVRDSLLVSGDAGATARNLIAHSERWQAGIVAELLMHLGDIPVMVILYFLLRPAGKLCAFMALLFNIVQTAVLVSVRLQLVSALLPLSNAAYLQGLDTHLLQAQAYTAIRLHDIGFSLGLLFFGATCLLNGYLIRRSGYIPKWIGALLQLAGLCYLANSLTLLLTPGFHSVLFPIALLPCFIAELSFCCWLIARGVRLDRWPNRPDL